LAALINDKEKKMLKREDFLQMRSGNIEEYAAFLIELSSSVVTDVVWRNSLMIDSDKRMKYGERITPSDEAFILFVILNSWVKWTRPKNSNQDMMVDDINEDDKLVLAEWEEKKTICSDKHGQDSEKCENVMMPNRYSGDKRRKADGIQGRNGWSTEGIKRYNDLFNKVKEDRRERGDLFDSVVGGLIDKHFDQRRSAKRVRRSNGVINTEAEVDQEPLVEWPEDDNS
jgi:hypothetical protein